MEEANTLWLAGSSSEFQLPHAMLTVASWEDKKNAVLNSSNHAYVLDTISKHHAFFRVNVPILSTIVTEKGHCKYLVQS